MDSLKHNLKEHIIAELNLEEVKAEEIDDDAPLFGDGGLGLDSIDALELIVLLEKYYSIKVTNPEEGKIIFQSVNSMADYIAQKKQ